MAVASRSETVATSRLPGGDAGRRGDRERRARLRVAGATGRADDRDRVDHVGLGQRAVIEPEGEEARGAPALERPVRALRRHVAAGGVVDDRRQHANAGAGAGGRQGQGSISLESRYRLLALEPPAPGARAESPLDGQVLLGPRRRDDDRLAAERGRTLDAPGMASPGSRAGAGRRQLEGAAVMANGDTPARRSRRGSGRPSGDRAGSSDRQGRARVRRTAPARCWSGDHRRSRPWRVMLRWR